jgi:ssDNA-binding Zn-finger/Zn-ribbon topoisomerase 1
MFKGKPKPAAQRAKMAKHWDAKRRARQAEIAVRVNKVENAKLKDYECPDCGTKFEQVKKGVYGGHRRYCLNYRNP